MAKERIFDLPETKGEYKVRGNVKGVQKDNFFKSTTTKAGKPKNVLKFGVETNTDSTVYLDLDGTERDEVYFYKKSETKGQKGTTKKVPWLKRADFKEEGYNLLGMKIGLNKVVDDKGKEKNDIHTYVEYDACEVLSKQLKDNLGVFVRGNIEYSSFTNDKDEVKRMIKFKPSQISGVSKDIDFSVEGFKPTNDFQQTIIFMEANMDESDPNDKKGVISAKIVNYSSIEDTEFIIRDGKLFKMFKNNLKPYTAIKVFGEIYNKVESQEEFEDDGWGVKNPFETTDKTFIKELVIKGADPSTIDKDTYSQKEMDKALKAINDSKQAKEEFGDNVKEDESWGEVQQNSNGSEDDGWD
jgi:hypothetical protein